MRKAATLLCLVTTALVLLGLVILYSTSSARNVDPHYFLKRQAIWLFVFAVPSACLLARLDYRVWRRFAIPLVLVTAFLLVLVLVPGIGLRVKGSSRWLGLGPLRVQPSEFGKIAIIAGMAAYMSRYGRLGDQVLRGALIPLTILGVFFVLLALEPDYGAAALYVLIGLVIMYAGGTRFLYLAGLACMGAAGLVVLVFHNPNRLARIKAFLDPEAYPDQAYHLTQSLYAFNLGGWHGVGLGNSMQKRFYLPEAHTDFIFSIVAEELGFFASVSVLLLFLLYFFCGLFISFRARDTFGRLLGFGLVMMIFLQALINLIVVTGLGPTKGLALPFLSYGGSSLVASLAITGILVSIARDGEEEGGGARKRARDRAHEL